MASRRTTLNKVYEACECEKSPYQIANDTGIAHTTVIRALRELERTGKVTQIQDASVYPRWVKIN